MITDYYYWERRRDVLSPFCRYKPRCRAHRYKIFISFHFVLINLTPNRDSPNIQSFIQRIQWLFWWRWIKWSIIIVLSENYVHSVIIIRIASESFVHCDYIDSYTKWFIWKESSSGSRRSSERRPIATVIVHSFVDLPAMTNFAHNGTSKIWPGVKKINSHNSPFQVNNLIIGVGVFTAGFARLSYHLRETPRTFVRTRIIFYRNVFKIREKSSV